MLNALPCSLWPLLFLLWRNIYLIPLSKFFKLLQIYFAKFPHAIVTLVPRILPFEGRSLERDWEASKYRECAWILLWVFMDSHFLDKHERLWQWGLAQRPASSLEIGEVPQHSPSGQEWPDLQSLTTVLTTTPPFPLSPTMGSGRGQCSPETWPASSP